MNIDSFPVALKRFGATMAAALMAVGLDVGSAVPAAAVTGTLVLAFSASEAEAAVGTVRRSSRRTGRRTSRRVTRRTTRRINTLPRGAAPVMIGGATYYYANNMYWEMVRQGGSTYYVQVIVE